MHTYLYSRGQWIAGHYSPDGKWNPEEFFSNMEDAAEWVSWLNGGAKNTCSRCEQRKTNEGKIARRWNKMEKYFNEIGFRVREGMDENEKDWVAVHNKEKTLQYHFSSIEEAEIFLKGWEAHKIQAPLIRKRYIEEDFVEQYGTTWEQLKEMIDSELQDKGITGGQIIESIHLSYPEKEFKFAGISIEKTKSDEIRIYDNLHKPE